MTEDTSAIRTQLLNELANADNADALKFAQDKLAAFDDVA